ncbi:MAG: hypothetical protein SFX73_13400 [Kofleriaceae bacterium]|nr:hypothetical protein [Kofleriaceae bacterium]
MTSLLPDETLGQLAHMSRAEIDELEVGVIKVDDTGLIELYSARESAIAGVAVQAAEGRNFFTQVAPCTNNRLLFGRFKTGVSVGELMFTLPYTFTYKMKPTNVYIQLYRDARSKTNWVLTKYR